MFDQTVELATQITNERHRALALRGIAEAQAETGFFEESLRTAQHIEVDLDEHLAGVAEAITKQRNTASFKRLLIPCAHYTNAAFKMCGLLARLYPEQATAVATVVCPRQLENQT